MSKRYHLPLVGLLALALGRAEAAGPYGLSNGSADPPGPGGPPAAPAFDPSAPPLAPPDGPAPPSDWEKSGRAPKKAAGTAGGEWGSLTTQTTVQDGWAPSAWEQPDWTRTWQTSESYRLPLAGPVFVFGQVGANSGEAAQQDMQVTGQTGLACKLPLGPVSDFQVRSGPRVAYTDPLRPDRTSSHSDWLVEVQARVPLLARVGLEYQGSAAPALTPLDHDWINQDLHLAIPVGAAGKFQLGAKHKWQDTAGSRAGTDSTQVYMGLELSR
jgi:hypothetical protein